MLTTRPSLSIAGDKDFIEALAKYRQNLAKAATAVTQTEQQELYKKANDDYQSAITIAIDKAKKSEPPSNEAYLDWLQLKSGDYTLVAVFQHMSDQYKKVNLAQAEIDNLNKKLDEFKNDIDHLLTVNFSSPDQLALSTKIEELDQAKRATISKQEKNKLSSDSSVLNSYAERYYEFHRRLLSRHLLSTWYQQAKNQHWLKSHTETLKELFIQLNAHRMLDDFAEEDKRFYQVLEDKATSAKQIGGIVEKAVMKKIIEDNKSEFQKAIDRFKNKIKDLKNNEEKLKKMVSAGKNALQLLLTSFGIVLYPAIALGLGAADLAKMLSSKVLNRPPSKSYLSQYHAYLQSNLQAGREWVIANKGKSFWIALGMVGGAALIPLLAPILGLSIGGGLVLTAALGGTAVATRTYIKQQLQKIETNYHEQVVVVGQQAIEQFSLDVVQKNKQDQARVNEQLRSEIQLAELSEKRLNVQQVRATTAQKTRRFCLRRRWWPPNR